MLERGCALLFACGVLTGAGLVSVYSKLNQAWYLSTRTYSSWILRNRGAFFGAGQIPIYYINLDRSENRKKAIERAYGTENYLHRVRGVDGSVHEEVAEWLAPLPEEGEGGSISGWTPKAKAHARVAARCRQWDATPGEIALTMGHWQALKRAFHDGNEVALVLEDDAVPNLAPFWTETLDELLARANAKFAGRWKMIRLQYTVKSPKQFQDLLVQGRREAPSGQFIRSRDVDHPWGTVAYLINRSGMRKMIWSLTALDLVHFDCSSLQRCASDFALPRLLDEQVSGFGGDEVLVAWPPMFTVGLLEDSTGTRSEANIYRRQSANPQAEPWTDVDRKSDQAKRRGYPPKVEEVGAHENSVARSFNAAVERWWSHELLVGWNLTAEEGLSEGGLVWNQLVSQSHSLWEPLSRSPRRVNLPWWTSLSDAVKKIFSGR